MADVCDLRPADLGYFDIVLFLGVLYHVKHPLLALERVCALATDLVCVESYVTDDGSDPRLKPAMEFYETTELCGQFDNWVGPEHGLPDGLVPGRWLRAGAPRRACWITALTWSAGAAGIRRKESVPRRTSFRWRTPSRSITIFRPRATIMFRCGSRRPGRRSARTKCLRRSAAYAARPVQVFASGGDGWHAIFKLPCGIAAGWSAVRVRVPGSAFSNPVRIGVDVSEEERQRRTLATPGGAEIRIEIVADGKTWERNQVRTRQDACISLWVRGMPEGCHAADVLVRLGGNDLPCIFLSEPDPAGLRQVNALLPPGLAPGQVDVNLVVAESVTAPVGVEVVAG